MITEQDFLEKMKAILENNDVTMDSELQATGGWDSMGLVEFLAMADANCGKRVEPEQADGCATIRELYALLQ